MALLPLCLALSTAFPQQHRDQECGCPALVDGPPFALSPQSVFQFPPCRAKVIVCSVSIGEGDESMK